MLFLGIFKKLHCLNIRNTFENIFKNYRCRFDKQYIYCRYFDTHNDMISD